MTYCWYSFLHYSSQSGLVHCCDHSQEENVSSKEHSNHKEHVPILYSLR